MGDMGASTSDIVDEEDTGGVRDATALALTGGHWYCNICANIDV